MKDDLLPRMEKTPWKYYYFQPLIHVVHAWLVFDLWMSKGGVDTYVFIAHFLNDKWESYHVTLGF